MNRFTEMLGRFTSAVQVQARTKGSSLERAITALESYCVSVQRILLWDNPTASAVALVLFNIFYWMLVSWSRRFISIISLASLAAVSYHAWVGYIWPEIRVPPPEDKDSEEWVPIHPQVLSAPEINTLVRNTRKMLRTTLARVVAQRRKNHGQFCLGMTCCFASLALVGHFIPGVVIVYLIAMSLSLGPGIVLYVLPQSWQESLKDIMFPAASSSSTFSSSSNSNTNLFESSTRMRDDVDADDKSGDLMNVPESNFDDNGSDASEEVSKITSTITEMGQYLRSSLEPYLPATTIATTTSSSPSSAIPTTSSNYSRNLLPPGYDEEDDDLLPKVPTSSPASPAARELQSATTDDSTQQTPPENPRSSGSYLPSYQDAAEMSTEAAEKIIQFVRNHFNGSSGSGSGGSEPKSGPHSPPDSADDGGSDPPSPPINEDEYDIVSEGELNASPVRHINPNPTFSSGDRQSDYDL